MATSYQVMISRSRLFTMDIDPITLFVVAGVAICGVILAFVARAVWRAPKRKNVNPLDELRDVWRDAGKFHARYRASRERGLDPGDAAERAKGDTRRSWIEDLSRRTSVPPVVLLAFAKAYPGYKMTPSAIESDASGALYEVTGEHLTDTDNYSDVASDRVIVIYREDGTLVDVPRGGPEPASVALDQLPPLIRHAAEQAVAGGRITFAHAPTPDAPTYEVIVLRDNIEHSVEIAPDGRVLRVERLQDDRSA
jgi:hypothetical protein